MKDVVREGGESRLVTECDAGLRRIMPGLFSKKPTSAEIATERLRVIISHDRIDMSPLKLDMLKEEIIGVISKFVRIDEEGIEVTLSQKGREETLTVIIPIIGERG
ncbi:MAG: cell division topological specificity factor MinE [bacterium]